MLLGAFRAHVNGLDAASGTSAWPPSRVGFNLTYGCPTPARYVFEARGAVSQNWSALRP